MLLADRAQWQRVVEDELFVNGTIDEVLRYSGSIVAWRRKALKDTEVAGVPIPDGAGLLLLMGSANRDDTQFEDPETFDIARPNAREHLASATASTTAWATSWPGCRPHRPAGGRPPRPGPAAGRPGIHHLPREHLLPRPRIRSRHVGGLAAMNDFQSNEYIQFFDGGIAPTLENLGGKGASLVTMTEAGMPVPPGFVVATAAFDAFMDARGHQRRNPRAAWPASTRRTWPPSTALSPAHPRGHHLPPGPRPGSAN